MLTEIIDLDAIRIRKKSAKSQKELDINASIVIIENCLKMLNNNNLPQLQCLKKELQDTLKILKKEIK